MASARCNATIGAQLTEHGAHRLDFAVHAYLNKKARPHAWGRASRSTEAYAARMF